MSQHAWQWRSERELLRFKRNGESQERRQKKHMTESEVMAAKVTLDSRL